MPDPGVLPWCLAEAVAIPEHVELIGGGSSQGSSGRRGGDSEKALYNEGKGMLTAWGFVEQAVLYCCRFLSKNVIKLYVLRGLLTSALKIKLLWRRKKKKKVLTSKILLFCYPSPF